MQNRPGPGWQDTMPGDAQGTQGQGPLPAEPPRTQLLPCKGQEGCILVQVLIEVDAQQTQLLLDAFDFLQERGVLKGEHCQRDPWVGVPPQKRRKVGRAGLWPEQLPACCAEQPHGLGVPSPALCGVSPKSAA